MLPEQSVNIVIRLHEHARIKVKVRNVESELESSIGVRQGSCEGPVLFLFTMQAAMETMKWKEPNPEYCTRTNGVTMGERSERKKGRRLLSSGSHSLLMTVSYSSIPAPTLSLAPATFSITFVNLGC